MEMDFWGSRAHSAKHHHHHHHHFHTLQSGRLNNADNHPMMDGEDDVRAWFPCPFCYVEIEIPVLCCHLQEEHCFDLKNAVFPSTLYLLINHLTFYNQSHFDLNRNGSVCPICAANLGKDAIAHFTSHHVHSVKRRRKSQKSGLWSNGMNIAREMTDRGNMQETTPDPLSAFFIKEAEEPKDHEEKSHRAAFVQQLIFSTIF
ncbi:Drought induced 19/ RING finger protein 114 [Cynara cardunculus var. scolymus]|uniref:Drought induced 19/ RING finger protein 114 n=1 Tax=Cynara cardunculus var. scolymus TaxID=59895 RepID=A0A118K3P0_CYNCS|nr:Drought induced 19/ RING finger protein 114 [Cynara cardunculus var. scolymus]